MKPPFCAKTEKGFTRRGALFTRALRALHATPVYMLLTKNYTLHANPCLHRRLHVTRKFLFIRVSVNPFLGNICKVPWGVDLRSELLAYRLFVMPVLLQSPSFEFSARLSSYIVTAIFQRKQVSVLRSGVTGIIPVRPLVPCHARWYNSNYIYLFITGNGTGRFPTGAVSP
jgi:hypothetical protein